MGIQDWTTVVATSLQELWVGSFRVLINLLGALIVFLVGLIVAGVLSSLVEKLINIIKLDKLLVSLDLRKYFERAGLNLNSAKFLGRVVYWFFVIVFILAATDILGFYSLSSFLREVVSYLPQVIVAVLIMLAAAIIANFLKRLVMSAVKSARLHSAGFLGMLTWWTVIVFGFLAALSQLGVAETLVNVLVTGLVAMLAIAGGLAFGLGGKDYAASLLNKLREHLER